MPEPTPADRRAAAGAGFFGHIAGFVAGLAEYLKVRLQLAGLEAKEAAGHLAIILALLVGAGVVTIFGYLFFCIALVFAIAVVLPWEHAWLWLTFAMALLHFGAAIAAVLMARARFSSPMFSTTLDELRKDQQWLNSTTAKRR